MSYSLEVYNEAELRRLFEKKGWKTKTLQYAEDPSEERPDLIPDTIALLNNKEELIGIVKVKMYESAAIESWCYWHKRLPEEAEQEAEQLLKGLDAQFVMFFINKKAIIYAKEKDSYKILPADNIPAPEEINNLISGEKAKDVSTIETNGEFASFLNSENSEEINCLIDFLERLIARYRQNLLSCSEKLHLLDIYQSEHQHRDGMYWKQAFAYFAAIFSLIILPRTETFHFEDIPPRWFSIAGVLLAVAWVFLVIAYRRRFMSINDAYNRVNQMLPEYYRRGPLYKESENSPFKWFVNLRMTTVVGVIFAILLCILAFIIWKYPMKYPINVVLPHCCE